MVWLAKQAGRGVMGHDLYRMIYDGAPAGWTALMRLVALLIADDARDPDGTPADGLPWSALPIDGRWDKRTGEWRDGLTQRAGASARAISDALTGLARAGYEMRVAIGYDKRGRPVFAANGHSMRFQVPPLSPRPTPPRPHPSATFGGDSSHESATFTVGLNGRRSHPAVERSHSAVSKVAPECDPISSGPPTTPSIPNGPDLTSPVESARARRDQDRDISPDQAAEAERRRQQNALDEWMRQHPPQPGKTVTAAASAAS